MPTIREKPVPVSPDAMKAHTRLIRAAANLVRNRTCYLEHTNREWDRLDGVMNNACRDVRDGSDAMLAELRQCQGKLNLAHEALSQLLADPSSSDAIDQARGLLTSDSNSQPELPKEIA